MSKIFWVSSKVLMSDLFFWTFCKYILKFSIIMLKHCSWLSKLNFSYFLRILCTYLCTNLYWIDVSKKGMHLNLLSGLLCSLDIWMNKGTVHLVIPGKVTVVFCFMEFITFDIFWLLYSTCKSCMPPLPIVLALGHA